MNKTVVSILQLSLIILALAGGWFGYSYINQVSSHVGGGFLWVLTVVLITVAATVIGLFLNIILHEGGHLIGGLLTGYGFVFFNVFNLTIIKQNGKLVRKKYRVPGTGGSCMLSPPDMKDGTYPYKLYISGGFLVNFLVSAICFGLFFSLTGTIDFLARAFLVIGIVGTFFGLTNFIPHNIVAPNDGYMLFNLENEKNTAMRHGWWSCFRIQALVAEGSRPRNIPAELFDWVDLGNISDVFVLETACNRYKYLLDKQEVNEARVLMQALCDNPHNVSEVQKMSFYCELLFHELIGECRQGEIDRLYTKALKDYIKATNSEISVLRLMYAHARLALNDSATAKEYLDLFHKSCAIAMYIWSGFVPFEQELISIIDTIADKRTSN